MDNPPGPKPELKIHSLFDLIYTDVKEDQKSEFKAPKYQDSVVTDLVWKAIH